MFPASSKNLSDGYSQAKQVALDFEALATEVRDLSAAGDISASVLMDLMGSTRQALALWAQVRGMPGIGAYAQEQDGTADVASEFSAMEAAAISLRDHIVTTLPKAAGDWLLVAKVLADGSIEMRQFTPAQTATLRTEIDGLLAAIG